MSAFCLEMHAGYLCRHAGACCTSGWPIAVEPPVVDAITVHFGAPGRERLVWRDGSEPPVLRIRPDGACAFFDAAHGRLCEIHGRLGPSALPSACWHFPRVVLADARGLHISLSHYCPTAAATLFEAAPVRVVEAPDSLSLDRSAEGLDAREALPPLLRPGMLMDVEAYDLWERHALTLFEDDRRSAAEVLDVLDASARRLATWQPGQGPLADHLRAVLASVDGDVAAHTRVDDRQAYGLAMASVPAAIEAPPVPSPGDAAAAAHLSMRHDRVVRRYLAARLFGNWFAYFVHGLDAIVQALRVHASVLRLEMERRAGGASDEREVVIEAIRATDLLLVHYSDPRALAALIEQAV